MASTPTTSLVTNPETLQQKIAAKMATTVGICTGTRFPFPNPEVLTLGLMKGLVHRLSSSGKVGVLDQKEIISLTLGPNTRAGTFAQSVDKASPRYHTSSLYNGRSKAQASILYQLRTGIARLNSYLKINAVRSEMCSCNSGFETVHHFLFYCPLWVEFRRSMRDLGYKHSRWGNTSFFVGGWSGLSKDGVEKTWKPNREAVWINLSHTISTGRLNSSKEELEGGATQIPDKSDAGEESDTNEEALGKIYNCHIIVSSKP